MQSPEREAQILDDVGDGGFSSSEFELLAELGRLSYVSPLADIYLHVFSSYTQSFAK